MPIILPKAPTPGNINFSAERISSPLETRDTRFAKPFDGVYHTPHIARTVVQ